MTADTPVQAGCLEDDYARLRTLVKALMLDRAAICGWSGRTFTADLDAGLPGDILLDARDGRLTAELDLPPQVNVSPQVPDPVVPLAPAGKWLRIAWFGKNQVTGYVTEVFRHGDKAAYHVDLPDRIWGGDDSAVKDFAADAWFDEDQVPMAAVYSEWAAHRAYLAQRRQREAEQKERLARPAITSGDVGADEHDDPYMRDYEDEGPV